MAQSKPWWSLLPVISMLERRKPTNQPDYVIVSFFNLCFAFAYMYKVTSFPLTFHSSFAAVAAAKKKISSVNECWSFVSEHTKVPSHDEWFGLNAELFRGESYWGWGEVYTCLRRPFFISRHSNQLAIFKSKLILRKMHFERRLQSRESLAERERISNKLHFRLKHVCQQRRVQLNAFRGFVDLVRRVDLEILSGSLAARRGREKQTLVKWRKFSIKHESKEPSKRLPIDTISKLRLRKWSLCRFSRALVFIARLCFRK